METRLDTNTQNQTGLTVEASRRSMEQTDLALDLARDVMEKE